MGKETNFFNEELFRQQMAATERLQQVEFLYFDQVDSTNDRARQLLIQSPHEFIIAAGTQTKGRGQYGRQWASHLQGNIYATFAFPYLPPVARLQDLSRKLALAIRRDFRDNYGLPLTVKPPNDLLLQGGKVAGILLESVVEIGGFLIGVGLNLHHDEAMQLECSKRINSLDSFIEIKPEDALLHLSDTTFNLVSWLTRD